MPVAKIVEALRVPHEQNTIEYHITVLYSMDDGTEVSRHKFIFPPTATVTEVRNAVIAYGQGLQAMVILTLVGQTMTL